jgi:predicted double-glycine peptidase
MIQVPLVSQTLGFSCGPASCRAALLYHGIDVPESQLIRECACDPEYGTHAERMVEVMREYLPRSWGRRRLGLAGLRRAISAGFPVIVMYLEGSGRGHYGVVCAVDTQVTLMDPQSMGRWDQIQLPAFLDRWKDRPVAPEYTKWGLVVQ